MARWRIVVHALDRTGPPMLARAFLRWLRAVHPDDDVDVLAFRGGELLHDFIALYPARVVLDPEEPWSSPPDPARVSELERRLGDLAPADATLLVSVASGTALPFLGASSGPIVTWVVEQGEPLPDGVASRTDRWLAGSEGTLAELQQHVPSASDGVVAPEFIERPDPASSLDRDRCRLALGAAPDEVLVVAAGIATTRKAPDLFLEIALAYRQRGAPPARFVWFGGERDPLFHPTIAEARRLGLDEVRMFGQVVDVTPWLAAADVFVHPARLDSFPLVCLHAAAAGTPVVAFSGVGGVPEMFGDSFRGAPYPDIAGMAAEIADVAATRHDVGERQRRRVAEHFTADVGGPVVYRWLVDAAEHQSGSR